MIELDRPNRRCCRVTRLFYGSCYGNRETDERKGVETDMMGFSFNTLHHSIGGSHVKDCILSPFCHVCHRIVPHYKGTG